MTMTATPKMFAPQIDKRKKNKGQSKANRYKSED